MPSLELSSGFEEKLLETAVRSPAAAMMRLSLEIDRQLRLILGVTGQLKDYTGRSPGEALDLIAKVAVGESVPSELRDTIDNYWSLRNSVIHSGDASSGISMRAFDYGLRILRILQSIPRPSFVVVNLVPVYSDKECIRLRSDVRGVILHLFGSHGEDHGLQIFPTTRSYTPGQSLSWEWDQMGKGWGETWYKDGVHGKPKLAWSEALEFIGRLLEEI